MSLLLYCGIFYTKVILSVCFSQDILLNDALYNNFPDNAAFSCTPEKASRSMTQERPNQVIILAN